MQELVTLYAVGGLSAEETARASDHLATCPACRALLSEYQAVANELLETVPAQPAPRRVGVRLQNLVTADASRLHRPLPTARTRTPFWNQVIMLPRWGAALALLAFLFLFGLLGALAWQGAQRDAQARQVMQLLTGRELRFVELTGASGTSGSKGFLYVEPDNPTALLWLYDMPPLDPAHVYQVWLRHDGARDNGGIFRVDAQGRTLAVIQAPRPFKSYLDVGITIEPEAGSDAPTTARVIGAKLD